MTTRFVCWLFFITILIGLILCTINFMIIFVGKFGWLILIEFSLNHHYFIIKLESKILSETFGSNLTWIKFSYWNQSRFWLRLLTSSSYRTTRIHVGSVKGDLEGVERRFKEDEEFIGSGGIWKVRVYSLETYDLLETVLDPKSIQRPHRVNPVRISKNLGNKKQQDKKLRIKMGEKISIIK